MPFISEEIYQNLTQEQSVHLADFPAADVKLINKELEKAMLKTRAIVEKAHAKRKEAQIKVRQPLSQFQYSGEKLANDLETLIAEEINVKKVVSGKSFNLDTKITPELKAEGEAREIIRQIQQARKAAGCELNEKITVKLPSWPNQFEDYIKRETLTEALVKSPRFEIQRK